ncbi:MAG: DNA polymerase III subunit gamma/tau [Calditrichaeota bacterium]|nr:MAG: DNA polymerase III subunit gamma/tau [Calditrichota bacterium]
MSYLATARKWRPQIFEDLIAQESITQTLKKAIESERIAQAYLFSGPRGVGKTTAARILAKAVNCTKLQNGNPCGECANCKNAFTGRGLDIFEIDGASNNSVDDVRELRESVKFPPINSHYKVFIIDEIHMLSKSAFNALLKTLEEPPPHLVFIFATTEPHKLLPTVLSRCQRYDFKSIPIDRIVERLKFIAKEENFKIDEGSLNLIAKTANGGMRDAETIFDQVVAYCGTEIHLENAQVAIGAFSEETFFELTNSIKTKEIGIVFQMVEKVVKGGFDLVEFSKGVTEHFRNLLVCNSLQSPDLVPLSEIYRKKYFEESQYFSTKDLVRLFDKSTEMENGIRHSEQKRFFLENSLVQMVKMDKSIEIEKLIQRIQELKKKFENANLSVSPPKIKVLQPQVNYSKIASKPQRQESVAKFEEPEKIVPKELPKQVEPSPKFQNSFEAQKIYSNFMASIKEEMPVYNSVLKNCSFENFENNTLFIKVILNNEFAKERLDSKTKELEKFLIKITNQDLRLNFLQICDFSKEPQKELEHSEIIENVKKSDPIVGEVLNLFGGKLTKIETTK